MEPTAAPHPHLYLASQSPRRQELLRQIGVRFELLLADGDEDAEALEAVLPGETPDDYVQRVCALKAQAAARRRAARGLPARPILTSDTTVCLGGEILGKPADAADAHRMLRGMSGREHRVLTAVTVVTSDGTPMHALSVSQVRFAVLTDVDIARYIASGEPFGKAGAYGIQGRAAAFVAHISGSYSGIMGLPLFETAALLAQAAITL
ncbi:septum formation inhibitor Maf [Ralstonia pseudosolanacearum]|uniref:Maf family protein n=1 Tax=Ralstonia pseudosolanacearum TaxID=1310165 RepID=UPI0008DA37AA|nr:Maf family protein [Ralstonia pseudosolanacearum]AZU55469.1 septum formation inhibitor Maf [Ralstonia solanacearum]MCK4138123.1 septum formation inhibitor Maf [Ralstonia pseudosolanacearum]OHU99678.1 septum formation inhibitor Maf [Ralstonia solanacearum]QVX38897.1 septum formation inhibitor Maf [Ralstonia solanacearum]RAA10199.1 septum formation inhibitor Maf [Ralstonia pseudosolanacearum]